MKLGITGFPLKTTLSPKLHRAFLKAHGLRGNYERFPFDPKKGKKSFFEFLDGLKREGVIGLNVTVPLKEWAYEYAKRSHPSAFGKAAKVVKAANTLLLQSQQCANTDAFGLWDDLQNWLGRKKDFDLLIVGTGGTARGAVAGLKCGHPFAKRCKSVEVWGRDPKKRAALLRLIRQKNKPSSKTKIVIWTLPPLSQSTARSIWGSCLMTSDYSNKDVYLYDANYSNRANATKKLLPSKQRKTGEGMLRRQAKYSFEIWRSSRAI